MAKKKKSSSPDPIGAALLDQSLALMGGLIDGNAGIREINHVWKRVGKAFDQFIGGPEFYDFDGEAAETIFNSTAQGEAKHPTLAGAIEGFREATYRLRERLKTMRSLVNSDAPIVIIRNELKFVALCWHRFAEATRGVVVPFDPY
jgi:hypothetical protein